MLKGNEIPTETHRACYHIRDLTDIKELRIKINPHYKLVSQVKLFLKSCFGLRYSFSHLENTLHTIPWHWVNPMDVIANKVKIFSPLKLEIIFCIGFVKHPKYQCPITSAEFNGSKQFFGIWVCGHTVSEPVLRELKGKTDTHKCPGIF